MDVNFKFKIGDRVSHVLMPTSVGIVVARRYVECEKGFAIIYDVAASVYGRDVFGVNNLECAEIELQLAVDKKDVEYTKLLDAIGVLVSRGEPEAAARLRETSELLRKDGVT